MVIEEKHNFVLQNYLCWLQQKSVWLEQSKEVVVS